MILMQEINDMQTKENNQLKYEIEFPGLPLAVYKEIAAHLRQVEGVKTGLYPMQSQQFDYNQSQVRALWIQFSRTIALESRDQVDRILAYYQNHYGNLEEVDS